MVDISLIRKKNSLFYFLPIFILLINFNAIAQTELTPQEYTLRTGDLIDVTVEGYPKYSKQIIVRIDGKVSYPIIGEIIAEGKTISSLEEEITRKLRAELDSSLNVYITLIRSRQNFIYVNGAVKIPNRYFFESERIYLLQVLSMAGGVDRETADLNHVQIRRNGKVENIVNLDKLINDKEIEDVILEPNDVVFVPNRMKQRPIYVTGAVIEQGNYYVEDENIHILKALRMAGGPKQDIADLNNAILIRSNGIMNKIDIEKLEHESIASEETAIFMNPGDILHIPNAYEEEKVSIIGDVRKPGQYLVKRPINIIEALSLGGGWENKTANLKEALIIKPDGTKKRVNLLEIIEKGEISEGPMLYPGDTLQIPRKFQINWSALLTVTSVISLIYNIFK